MRVVVVGQGYVGLPLAIRAAEVGHQVVGYDVDARRVKSLAAGESYVEDVSSERLSRALELGTYQASELARDCGGFDVAVVTVPTPLQDGAPDLRYIEESAHTLARFLRPGATVVLESTTYPGTTEELFGPILEDGSGLTAGVDFHLGYSPERIDPGNTVWGFQQTPKVVSGVNASSLKAVETFYASLVDTTVPVRSPKEAELAKLLENTFRHVNIALVNEIAMFARHLDIDVWQTIEAAASKPFGFMKFTPGPGVGGHCLPIDPSYLSWRVQRELGQNFRFVELANDINSHMPEYVARRVMDALNAKRRSVNGSRILILGLAYKKNTGDARESPAVRVAQLLLDMGAKVRAADPHVVEGITVDARLSRVEPTRKELTSADVVVLLTDHDSFDYAMVTEHASLILDCRNRLSGPKVEVL
ncbi:nucleotide sugar dehydrogenase [Streptomyces sp. ISL-43]|uniref:nucleotide sugar dehydrogenase n=1 Tax=Streptomyces sp. ISL-43 TaxID=2819183 RepID=UPI001BEB915F|nr:nucleotide sugar dehydrogenase [Streptomyces sp. ISL-43]MBT2450739.1 nucleotide sugar dehydrogenase [Streptomyces sp. ISL-43]